MSIRNLDAVFKPKRVALFGASTQEGSVGWHVARNMVHAGFDGVVNFVNPKGGALFGHRLHASIDELPEPPDLAVIVTPPDTVPDIVAQAGERGARAAVVVTAGFGEGEADTQGRERRQKLLDAARPHTLRIVGPNCVGLILPRLGLNASFAPDDVRPGNVAFLAQSGAIITTVLDRARDRGVGFSHVVSVGDMADADFGDLLDYLALDPSTKAVALYMEAATEGRKFMSAARALARMKPVIVLKTGRHAAGARAATSHTGALGGADAVYEAAFRRAGLVRVYTLDALFGAVAILAHRQQPKSGGLTVVSNGGGAGVLAADGLGDTGYSLAELADETVEALDRVLPPTWSHGNPVDIIGDADRGRYGAALDAVAQDPNTGAILVMNAPTALASSTEAAKAVIDNEAARRRALIACWLGGNRADEARQLMGEAGIPVYDAPEEAVRAYAQMMDYRRGQESLKQVPPAMPERDPYDRTAARDIMRKVLEEDRDILTEPEAKSVLSAYGVPVARTELASDAGEAATLAEEIGFPVALKILSPDITHKSDVGGVALNLSSAEAVRRAAEAMQARIAEREPDARLTGFTVQAMIRRPNAYELIVGAAEDTLFGPYLLFGQGGTAAEQIGDTAIALPPLNLALAREQIERTKIYRLLRGYRDRPQAALEEIEMTLVRVADMLADHPEIKELDINPLLADEDGVIAVDARIVVGAWDESVPADSRFAIRPYPNHLEERVRLKDRELLLRPIRPEDEPDLIEHFHELSPEDIRMRFFAPIKHLSHDMAARLTQIDYDREMALVLVDPPDDDRGNRYGIVRLSADPDFASAEFAILVWPEHRGKGFGPFLLKRIVRYARERGIGRVYGEILSENRAMIALAKSVGFEIKRNADDPSVVEAEIRTGAGAEGEDQAAVSRA